MRHRPRGVSQGFAIHTLPGSSAGVNLRRLLACALSEAHSLSYVSQWPAVNFLRAVFDIPRKATAVKERANRNDRLYCYTQNPRLYSYKLYCRCVLAVHGRSHATVALVRRLTIQVLYYSANCVSPYSVFCLYYYHLYTTTLILLN